MSNPNSPFGFLPVGPTPGSPTPSGALLPKRILFSNSTPIYKGDPVKLLTSGYVTQWTQGTAASQLAGIFWGCSYLSASLGRTQNNTYWPGSDLTSGYATAYLLPCIGSGSNPMFKVQSDSTAFTVADIGATIDVTVGTGTPGIYGKSGASLAYATLGTASTLPWRIYDLYSTSSAPGTAGTDDTSANNIVIVYANVDGETGI